MHAKALRFFLYNNWVMFYRTMLCISGSLIAVDLQNSFIWCLALLNMTDS